MNAEDRPSGSEVLFTEVLYKDLGNLYKNWSITSPIADVIRQNINIFPESLNIACFKRLITITGTQLSTLCKGRVCGCRNPPKMTMRLATRGWSTAAVSEG